MITERTAMPRMIYQRKAVKMKVKNGRLKFRSSQIYSFLHRKENPAGIVAGAIALSNFYFVFRQPWRGPPSFEKLETATIFRPQHSKSAHPARHLTTQSNYS